MLFFKLKIETGLTAKKISALQRVPRREFLAKETISAKALGYFKKLPAGLCAGGTEHKRGRVMGGNVREGRGQIWNSKANFLCER